MQVVPIEAIPNQTLQVQLDNQSCEIAVYQTGNGVFLDLTVGGSPIISGVVCENLNRIVRSLYLGFSGDLMFMDTQGSSDPFYTGLGSRFVLLYLLPSELPPGQG